MFTTLQLVEVPCHDNVGNSMVVDIVQADNKLYIIAPYYRPFVRGIPRNAEHTGAFYVDELRRGEWCSSEARGLLSRGK